ncbi:tRNA threonylcarbamoyladenosine biosynthesis protein TsaB [Gammaproteobacteria bacterium]
MKLLAIETSTDACSCALWFHGEVLERFELSPRKHGELILSMVDSLLSAGEISLSNLDGIAFGRGPGAFTGLRIAAGVTQGLAFSHDLLVVPVSSLAALAQGVFLPEKINNVFVIQDARMDEVYCGTFSRDPFMKSLSKEQVCKPEQIIIPEEDGCWMIVGSAWKMYGHTLEKVFFGKDFLFSEHQYPRAKEVAYLGEKLLFSGFGVSPEQAIPVYLRDEVAKVPKRLV